MTTPPARARGGWAIPPKRRADRNEQQEVFDAFAEAYDRLSDEQKLELQRQWTAEGIAYRRMCKVAQAAFAAGPGPIQVVVLCWCGRKLGEIRRSHRGPLVLFEPRSRSPRNRKVQLYASGPLNGPTEHSAIHPFMLEFFGPGSPGDGLTIPAVCARHGDLDVPSGPLVEAVTRARQTREEVKVWMQQRSSGDS